MNSNTKPNGTTKLPYKVVMVNEGNRVCSAHKTEKAALAMVRKIKLAYAKMDFVPAREKDPVIEIEVIV